MKAKVVILGLALAACAGNPQPGDPGYAYNLSGEYAGEFVADDGSAFAATLQLETLPGGEVTGTMSITDPMSISGDVAGVIVGAEASLEIAYLVADAGCGGVVAGSAVIEAGGTGTSGSLTVTEDDCGDGPSALTFALTRTGG